MTDDERLAAIRARLRTAGTGNLSESRLAQQDVPWLLDRLAEVTAERDEARAAAEWCESHLGPDTKTVARAKRAEAALARVTALCNRLSDDLLYEPNRYVAISKVCAAVRGEV